MKKRTIGILLGLVIVLSGSAAAWTVTHVKQPADSTVTQTTQSQNKQPTPPDTGSFDKKSHSISESSSIWVIANKKHPLAKGYAPEKLVVPSIPLRLSSSEEQMQVSSVMAPALQEMVAAAKKDNVNLMLSSGYRSETLQTQFYNNYVAKDGQAAADRYSARPGTSEHQTGLAADMIPTNDKCHLEVCFAQTAEGKWLAAHAHEYGFIIRYLDGKEAETTYQYEPWHIRYVGKELAAQLHTSGQTMEAFFDYLN